MSATDTQRSTSLPALGYDKLPLFKEILQFLTNEKTFRLTNPNLVILSFWAPAKNLFVNQFIIDSSLRSEWHANFDLCNCKYKQFKRNGPEIGCYRPISWPRLKIWLFTSAAEHLFRRPDFVQVHEFDLFAASAISAAGAGECHSTFSAAVEVVFTRTQ